MNSCGFTDVVKTQTGKYVCAKCGKAMDSSWPAWIEWLGLKLPNAPR